jgi:hypothetical protein
VCLPIGPSGVFLNSSLKILGYMFGSSRPPLGRTLTSDLVEKVDDDIVFLDS